MPHIRLIEVDEATGPLRDEHDAAIGRAGKVFNIVKSMSLRPGVLKRSRAQTRSWQTMPRTTTGRPTWSRAYAHSATSP